MDKDVQATAVPAPEAGPAAASVEAVLAAIGEEAFEKTGGDIWQSGKDPEFTSPAVEKAVVEKNEGSAPVEPADGGSTPPQAKPLTVSEAEKVILAELGPLVGKYNSLDELKQGIHRLTHERTEYLTKTQMFEAAAARASETPPPNLPPEDPLDQLEILGLPKEPLIQAIDFAVRRTIEQANQAEVAKYEARVKADSEVIEKYPEYKERFDDLSKWLDTRPDLKGKVVEAEKAGYHTLAREFAWLNFSREVDSPKEAILKEEAKVAATKAKDFRTDAQVLTNGQEPNARVQPTEEQVASERKIIKREELDRLVGLARDGYAAPLWRRAIGETLPKEVFPD
jgi:hypothetical protein